MSLFTLPDTFVVAPVRTAEFDPVAVEAAGKVIAAGPESVYHRLVSDQESEVVLLVARHVLNGFLDAARSPGTGEVTEIVERTAGVRQRIARLLAPVRAAEPRVRDAVLAQRAPLALIGGCWLDRVSQPATQPAIVVNHLVRDQFVWRGHGNPRRALHRVRGNALEELGLFLPEVTAVDFLPQAGARALTAWHGAYQLSLGKLSATFLPEVVGTHYVVAALGTDELLLGTRPMLDEADLRATLADYLALAPPPVRNRLHAAVARTLALELEHAGLLAEVAEWTSALSLDAQVARIVARHAPFAGKQHRHIRVGGRPLTQWFTTTTDTAPAVDATATTSTAAAATAAATAAAATAATAAAAAADAASFVREFRASPYLRPRAGGCRFLRAIRFGGPMFGIFDEREAATFQRWAAAIAAGEPTGPGLTVNTAGDEAARTLAAAVGATPPGVVVRPGERGDDREFLHRLVNVENFPNVLPIARAYAAEGLDRAEILFDHGAAGTLTDASWFDYSPSALNERVDRIYWDKLVDPYRPLTEVPERDEVIFGQRTFALGSMIDGAWAHRIGATGRYDRRSDGLLYSIYADEMGRGDLGKNHITLIYQVLASMDIRVPHIREAAFLDQDELPDHLYGFSLFQLGLALFPDSYYDEILGYNLGIEMFGLGTMRMHEMQKLRHHRLDIAYEEAHLSIDNLSAGHARQSADIVIAYLHDVAKLAGQGGVPAHWRRIWRGYASFAYFVEHELVAGLDQPEPTDLVI